MFFSELNDFVIQLDEEVEGMQSTILTLQQQLKDVKQKMMQSQEETGRLRSHLEETEKAFAAIKSHRLDSPASAHTDTEHDIQLISSSPCQSPDIKTNSRTNEADSGSENEHDPLSAKIPKSQSEDSCSNISKPLSNTTSFSICKILAADMNETRETIVPESREGVIQGSVVTPSKAENGQEGQERLSLYSHLDVSAAPQLTSKGVVDGLGHDTVAHNGEVVK